MKIQASTLLANALSNPLVQRLPPFMSDLELATQLSNQPFFDIDWSSVPVGRRAVLLNQLKTTFCVTEFSIRVASSLQSLLWDGLLARDPCQPSQRRLIYEIAAYDETKFKDQPWRHEFTGGITVRGITGVGKSAAVNRFLSLLPKMIQHGRNESAQWVEFRQLVYLKVPMSSDGSRGGFLLNCLGAMDEILGTDYFQRHQSKQCTVEKLLVHVLHYLALHRCGLLIIEEVQEKNMATSQFSRDFLTFFLRLLNHGVPVVIIGNPLAFAELDSFSQDVSRFSEYGDFRIDPIFEFQDEEWSEVWIPQLWGASLLDNEDEPIEALAELIWNFTAGFPRYLARLRRETLLAAIQMESSCVKREHIDIAWASPPMKGVRKLIVAFTSRNWRLLEGTKDIPIDQIKSQWEKLTSGVKSDFPISAVDANVDDVGPTSSDSNVSTFSPNSSKTAKRKKVTNKVKEKGVTQQFGPDDIRSQTYVDSLSMRKNLPFAP